MRHNKKLWFSITAKDCRFQNYKASGKGGQKRNKVASAVRCYHDPSGAVGQCEEFKEPKRNKKIAFQRMAESAKFQSWLKLRIDAGLGKVEIKEGNNSPRKLNMDEV